MSISYGELAYIQGLTNEGLKDLYDEVTDPYNSERHGMSEEDIQDYENAVLIEMGGRGMPHP